jgi:hypothetical protein
LNTPDRRREQYRAEYDADSYRRVFLGKRKEPVEPALGHVDGILLQMRPEHPDLVAEMLDALTDCVHAVLHRCFRDMQDFVGLIYDAGPRGVFVELYARSGRHPRTPQDAVLSGKLPRPKVSQLSFKGTNGSKDKEPRACSGGSPSPTVASRALCSQRAKRPARDSGLK